MKRIIICLSLLFSLALCGWAIVADRMNDTEPLDYKAVKKGEPVFKGIKKKFTQAAANQCKFNIKLNLKTLVGISNAVDERIVASGGLVNEGDTRRVVNAQKELLTDIILAHSNGLTIETIKKTVIEPELTKIQVTPGARLAIDHVIKAAKETVSLQQTS